MKTNHHPCQSNCNHMNRRQFLKLAGLTAAGLLVSSCNPEPTASPTIEPTAAQVFTPTAQAAATPANLQQSLVSIARADSYDPKLIKQQMQTLFDSIGGLDDVLQHGNRVAIKVNLTGGISIDNNPSAPAIESYMTHPEVVRAAAELLRDAGATKIYIVEAVYEPESWTKYGYVSMSKEIGADLIDLNYAEPYADMVDTTSSTDPYFYESFKFNPILNEIDAFVSISKMKCHNTAGVTHTMKNLFGIAPQRFYALNPSDLYRSAFHGEGGEPNSRVPRVIIDLNRARPVNLGIIDGVWTSEGGEGMWIEGAAQVKPGVLMAGKDPVATDAVATAAMGFDPTADYPSEPFVNGTNHLNLAYAKGLGTNKLEEIKVVGASIDDVKMNFKVSY